MGEWIFRFETPSDPADHWAPESPSPLAETARPGRVLVAALVVAFLLALSSRPRWEGPVDDVERARLALRRAKIEAAAWAPQAVEEARDRGFAMERRLAAERHRSLGFRRSYPIRALALEAEVAAHRALWLARREALKAGEETAGARQALEASAATLAAELAHSPGDRPLRQAFRRAHLALKVAEAAERRQDFSAARGELAIAAQELSWSEARVHQRYSRLNDSGWRRRWQRWVNEVVAYSRRGRPAVVVDKLGRRCVLLRNGRVVATYRAELGRNGLEDKLYSGDAATPEGRYRVVEKRGPGQTIYHLALLLNYPNPEDWRAYQAALRRGWIPRGRGIGGLIEIHGEGGKGINWTDGCVALPNDQMAALFRQVEVGTPVAIVGTARLPGERRDR